MNHIIEIRFDLVDNISFLGEYVRQPGYHTICMNRINDVIELYKYFIIVNYRIETLKWKYIQTET